MGLGWGLGWGWVGVVVGKLGLGILSWILIAGNARLLN